MCASTTGHLSGGDSDTTLQTSRPPALRLARTLRKGVDLHRWLHNMQAVRDSGEIEEFMHGYIAFEFS